MRRISTGAALLIAALTLPAAAGEVSGRLGTRRVLRLRPWQQLQARAASRASMERIELFQRLTRDFRLEDRQMQTIQRALHDAPGDVAHRVRRVMSQRETSVGFALSVQGSKTLQAWNGSSLVEFDLGTGRVHFLEIPAQVPKSLVGARAYGVRMRSRALIRMSRFLKEDYSAVVPGALVPLGEVLGESLARASISELRGLVRLLESAPVLVRRVQRGKNTIIEVRHRDELAKIDVLRRDISFLASPD